MNVHSLCCLRRRTPQLAAGLGDTNMSQVLPKAEELSLKSDKDMSLCRGCQNFKQRVSQLTSSYAPKLLDQKEYVHIHKDYKELCDCAESCSLCRFFLSEVDYSVSRETHDHHYYIWIVAEYSRDFKIEFRDGRPSALNWGGRYPYAHELRPEWRTATCEDSNYNLQRADPDISSALELSLQWLTTCVNEHKDCGSQSPEEQNFLPTRLLEVGKPGQHSVRLILSQDLAVNQEYEYSTLSYCWGQANLAACTTKENLRERLNAMSIDLLPKTIQDAITITRAIGIRYLWVDALCILQNHDGENEDWGRESVNMGKIYRHSLLTIAASAATDSSKGCFPTEGATRRPMGDYALIYERKRSGSRNCLWLRASPPNWTLAVELSALAARGWAMQERMLGSRKLFWTREGLFWECGQMNTSEHGPVTLKLENFPTLLDLADSIRGCSTKWKRNAWVRLVEEFTRKALSVRTDKIPAILGLGNTLSAMTNLRFEMGVWSHNLIRETGWHGLTFPGGVRLPGLPSWSWASTNQPAFFTPLSSHAKCSDLATAAIHDGLELHVHGLLGQMEALPPTQQSFKFHFNPRASQQIIMAQEDARGDSIDGRIVFDIPSDGLPENGGTFEIILWMRSFDEHYSTDMTSALVVSRINSERHVYRRIGWVECTSRQSERFVLEARDIVIV